MIYLMQRVPHVQTEYAHIQQVQAHLQFPGVDIGTSSWAHEAWHALHGQYYSTKVRLSGSLSPVELRINLEIGAVV
jgi:hypothetical protein